VVVVGGGWCEVNGVRCGVGGYGGVGGCSGHVWGIEWWWFGNQVCGVVYVEVSTCHVIELLRVGLNDLCFFYCITMAHGGVGFSYKYSTFLNFCHSPLPPK
jgi:hypothetical protein